MNNITLTPMAFGDIRLVSFLWAKYLLPGDSITGSPDVTFTSPLIAGSVVAVVGSTVICSFTAGTFPGTAQLTCVILTAEGEKATRTAYVAVKSPVS